MSGLCNFNGLASWRDAEKSLESVNLTMPSDTPTQHRYPPQVPAQSVAASSIYLRPNNAFEPSQSLPNRRQNSSKIWLSFKGAEQADFLTLPKFELDVFKYFDVIIRFERRG